MYAIIKTGGKQIKVEEGQAVYIEKFDVEAGEKVVFDQVSFSRRRIYESRSSYRCRCNC